MVSLKDGIHLHQSNSSIQFITYLLTYIVINYILFRYYFENKKITIINYYSTKVLILASVNGAISKAPHGSEIIQVVVCVVSVITVVVGSGVVV